jgi:hypothetical protein
VGEKVKNEENEPMIWNREKKLTSENWGWLSQIYTREHEEVMSV